MNCLSILNEVLNNLSPNKENMSKLANTGYITATDLADYLVKNHSITFRNAYQKTAAIVNLAERKKKRLEDLDITELKKIEPAIHKGRQNKFSNLCIYWPNFLNFRYIMF